MHVCQQDLCGTVTLPRLSVCTTARRVRAGGLIAIIVSAAQTMTAQQSIPVPSTEFAEVAGDLGLDFVHHSPFTAERHLHLTMGSGVAWLDIENDGWPDAYLAQGRAWDPASARAPDAQARHRLYRNRFGRFTDITARTGIVNDQYGMGLAVADADNDGFDDIFVSSFGHNQLFMNNGDGTFRRASAGLDSGDWSFSASATWVDADTDGFPDLYVTNYLTVDPRNYTVCTQMFRQKPVPIPCPPRRYPWPGDSLYRNTGDGEFTDASASVGLPQLPPSPGLGVVTADLNDDAYPDLYVANDTTANFLLMNDTQGHFQDEALAAGAAFNRLGEAEAGMGVACGDVDGDGRLDLFVGNYYGETNTLYRNEGRGSFLDVTAEFGLAAPSRTRLAFGTLLTDFNNDGWLDLFVANGHLSDQLEAIGMNIPFRQKALLQMNDEGRHFHDLSPQAGDYFHREVLGRGCAAADFDNDGDLDIAVQHLNAAVGLLQNNSSSDLRSISLRLIGTRGSRSALGARVRVTAADRMLLRHRDGSTSYLSCSDPRLLIGLGRRTEWVSVEVRWPGGGVDTWRGIAPGDSVILIEGRALWFADTTP